jgi:hypothetical protein
MSAPVKHVSSLELDSLILGGPASAAVLGHVGSCPVCSAYVAGAREFQRSQAGLPEWVVALGNSAAPSALPQPAFPPAARQRTGPVARWSRLGPPLLAAAALVGSLVLMRNVGSERPEPEHGYVGRKGGPSVGVYVKRQERVFLWDGAASLHVGDRIRLSIAGAEYRHVAVLSEAQAGLVPLYRGELRAPGELPVAWSIDAEGDAERLIVVLSHRLLSEVELADVGRRAQRAAPLPPDIWVGRYLLPKQRGAEQ